MNKPSKRSAKRLSKLVIGILLGASLIYSGYIANSAGQKQNSISANSPQSKVVKVIDGDTAQIEINGQIKTVRYIGMDTPEIVDPRKTVQCFGREASARAHELLDNQIVQLEFDKLVGEQDKYGRLLAYVILSDGKIYNKQMIAEGYAKEYTYQDQEYKYQADFKSAQVDAESASLGLWSQSTCAGDTTQPAK